MDYRRKLSFLAATLLFTLIAAMLAPSTALALKSAALRSGIKDRVKLELTVYNDNFAFIRDTREVAIKKGTGRLEFTEVPTTILQETILLRSLEKKNTFTVLEQSFQRALQGKNALLESYLGKKIRLEVWNKFNDRISSVDATLLSNSNGPVYKIGEEIYLGHPGVPVLPAMPKGRAAEPQINWRYMADSTDTYRLEASYLAANLKWRALYRLVLHGEGNSVKAALTGSIALTNKSGTDFTGARVRFVAGRPHMERGETGLNYSIKTMSRVQQFSETLQPSESPFFEYHIYDISREISINNGEQKELRLLESTRLTVDKEFELRGRTAYFRTPLRRNNNEEPVYAYLKFNNSQANGLGTTLPAGIMNIYMENPKGGLEFIGSDNVRHTAKKRDLRLKAGIAGDIIATRTQKEYKRITSLLFETAWEIKLTNNKREDVVVNILEPLTGSWKILSSNHAYKKIDAFTVKFKVSVPAGKEVSVKYRARVER